MKSKETVGIVGFGAMGRFMANTLFASSDVVACDPAITLGHVDGVEIVDLSQVAQQDTIVLATPVQALHDVLPQLDRHMPDAITDQLVIEVGSVKELPERVFERFWPNYPELLLCHPLFGPESAKEALQGHRMLVTTAAGQRAEDILKDWREKGLEINHMSAEEHDRQMLGVQALPFILGRLARMAAVGDADEFETPSRAAVRRLERMDEVHSDALFRTMVNCNSNTGALLDSLASAIDGLRKAYAEDAVRAQQAETDAILGMNRAKIAGMRK